MRAPRLILVAIVTVLVALPAAGAGADQPTREVEEVSLDFTTESCGFPVLVHFEGQVTSLAFDANGTGTVRLFEGGAFVATLTNPATGETLRVNISGPHLIYIAPDGSIYSPHPGPWLFTRRNPITGEPGIWLLRGLQVHTVDANGNPVSWSFVGTSQNLCLDLAACPAGATV